MNSIRENRKSPKMVVSSPDHIILMSLRRSTSGCKMNNCSQIKKNCKDRNSNIHSKVGRKKSTKVSTIFSDSQKRNRLKF